MRSLAGHRRQRSGVARLRSHSAAADHWRQARARRRGDLRRRDSGGAAALACTLPGPSSTPQASPHPISPPPSPLVPHVTSHSSWQAAAPQRSLSKSVSAPGLIKSMTAPLKFSTTVPSAPVRLTPVVRGEPTSGSKKEQRQKRLDPGLRLREERRRLAQLARERDQEALSQVQWEERQRRPHWERPGA